MFRVSVFWEPLLDLTLVGTDCSEESNIHKVLKLTMTAYECFVAASARKTALYIAQINKSL